MGRENSFLPFLICVVAGCGEADAPATSVLLGTTTSVENTGLLHALLPAFTAETGIRVDVVAGGTGRALTLGRDGEVDLLLVHDPEGEMRFLENGYGVSRRSLWKNRFRIAGPPDDPAGIRGLPVGEAVERLEAALEEGRARFVSRGDDSGTHRREVRLWGGRLDRVRAAPGYLETGQGMGPTLVVASEKGGYVLADSGTFGSFRGRLTLETLVTEGDALENIYSVVLLSPERHPDLRHEASLRLADWFASERAGHLSRAVTAGGEPLFERIP